MAATLIRVLIGLLCLTLAGCQLRTGYIRLAQPKAYDSETTRKALAAGGAGVAKKIREDANIATHVQDAASTAELNAFSARIAGQQAPAGAPPVTPTAPSAATPTAPTLARAVGQQAFGRTIDEHVNDLLHTENQAIEVDLLYAAKGDSALGKNARVYLVRFDIGLFPSRQSWWTYPYWAGRSWLNSTYRFTQGWFAQVRFVIPKQEGQEQPPAYVYDIDPRHAVLTSIDSLANVSQLQLAAAYMAPGVAGQLDYMNRLEEQFAQQRRYPLQMGLIDGRYSFEWVFGPRRQIHRRGWVRFIPFVADYTVESRLEPGTRTGHAILVVPDIEALKPSPKVEISALSTLIGQSQTPVGGKEPSFEPQVCPEQKSERHARVCLVATAGYLELEQPTDIVSIPLSPLFEEEGNRGDDLSVLVPIDLPLDPPAKPSSAELKLASGYPILETNPVPRLRFRLLPENSDLLKQSFPKVRVMDEEERVVKVLAVERVEKSSLDFTSEVPLLPSVCEATPCANPKTKLTVFLESAGVQREVEHQYSGSSWRPREKTASLECGKAAEGSPNALRFDRDLPLAEQVEFVQFGKVRVTPATAGWKVRNPTSTLFDVPPQPAPSDRRAAPVSTVAVTVYFKADSKQNPVELADFVYDASAGCAVKIAQSEAP
jgi:hypothetical protein